MRVFSVTKDGGPFSTVWAYWLIEWKRLFSIALLRFEDGTREVFHSHAFNCISFVLSGKLVEEHLDGHIDTHPAGFTPVLTSRNTFHKVASQGRTWVLTFRGPWATSWEEYDSNTKETTTLLDGRVVGGVARKVA